MGSPSFSAMAKIMIVEDDMTTNNLVGDYLIDAGHTIFSAYDGLEALPIENFVKLSLHYRRRKRLVQPTIQCFQRFPATLFLYQEGLSFL